MHAILSYHVCSIDNYSLAPSGMPRGCQYTLIYIDVLKYNKCNNELSGLGRGQHIGLNCPHSVWIKH